MWNDFALVLVALSLVAVNGFFVAAEFALIKVRPQRIDALVREQRPFALAARWLSRRMDPTLAACQLGITMASLGLGWIGEPAFARLLDPLFQFLGVASAPVRHGVSFILAFSLITALHLVVGEQVPKIFSLRRPERLLLLCAAPLKLSYYLFYPPLIALSAVTSFILRRFGVEEGSEHEAPRSEEELRALVGQARVHGILSSMEHRLLDAVFAFDDIVCRRIMLARQDVVFFDLDRPVTEFLELAQRTRHTRYPVCEGSLDRVVGVVHLKDLVGIEDPAQLDLRAFMRPPRYVPETMPVSRLLRHFQATRQHMAFLVDEHGTVVGIATLENVIEQIVGPLADEFDEPMPAIVPQEAGEYLVAGSISIEKLSSQMDLDLDATEADTLSGLLTLRLDRLPEVGDRVELPGASVEVLEVVHSRAHRLRLRRTPPQDD